LHWPRDSARYDLPKSLAGNGGGGCELKGRKLFFLDLDVGPEHQLEQVPE